MKKILGYYDKLEEYLLVSSLVVTVCLIFAQVVMRYVFNSSLSWSEELARYIFIWQIWLGASLGIRERKHIRVELIYGFFKNKVQQHVIDILATIIWIGFCIFLAVGGTQLTLDLIQKGSVSSAMRIPMYLIYVSLPVSCGIMGLRLVQQVYEMIVTLVGIKGGKA
ncbi:TRAP transporter small permease [Clostridiaceae bacterium 35-E11]